MDILKIDPLLVVRVIRLVRHGEGSYRCDVVENRAPGREEIKISTAERKSWREGTKRRTRKSMMEMRKNRQIKKQAWRRREMRDVGATRYPLSDDS